MRFRGAPSNRTLGPSTPRNLVIQTAFVGDLLLSVPLLKAVRAKRPDAELWLLCRDGLADFAMHSGLVDRVIEKSARNELLSTSFDCVYSPHRSPRTALLVARLKARRKIGFRARWNGFAFGERVPRSPGLPDVLRQLSLFAFDDSELAARLTEFEKNEGLASPSMTERRTLRLSSPPVWASMEISKLATLRNGSAGASPETLEAAQRLGLFDGKQTLFIAPGSVWATKRWREDGFAEIARTRMAVGWNAVFIGAPGEEAVVERALALAPGARKEVGQLTLWQTCELLALGDQLIGNDSGAMHMAALSGLPSVAIFGPTTLDLGYRPWSALASVAQIDLPCRPCGKHGSNHCPIGTHACMRDLSAAEILRAAEQIHQ